MGYRTAEEITLPARFLTTTAHLVAVLTIIFDARTLAGQMLLKDGDLPIVPSATGTVDTLAHQLSSIAYAAIACFAVEYCGLFMGFSLFLRAHNCLYILLHFMGTIITGLMYTQAGSVGAFIACLVVFNCLPAALELLTFLVVAKLSIFAY